MSYGEGSLTCLVAEIQECKRRLSAGDVTASDVQELAARLMEVVQHVPMLHRDETTHAAVITQVEDCAVSLWNTTVARKTGGALDALTNAQLRHVAAHLMFACQDSDTAEEGLRKQILMALKAIQAWLDCKKSDMCDGLLSQAQKCLQRLRTTLDPAGADPGTCDGVHEDLLSVNRDRFKLLCYQAEVAMMQNEYQKALAAMQEAKTVIKILPSESVFLSMLCYNFGVEACRAHRYEESTVWLKDSYELGNGREGVSLKNQARTLRLLATVYLDWNSEQHCQKARNAIDMANAEHSHPASFCLKLRILLYSNDSQDKLEKCLIEALNHPELTVDIGLSAIELLISNGRKSLGLEGLIQLQDHFKSSSDRPQLWASQMELLLRLNLVQEAQDLLKTGIQDNIAAISLDDNARKRLHALAWEKAAEYFESKSFADALSWYKFSEVLFSIDPLAECNQGKLHRNQASCYLELNTLGKARDHAEKAARIDPASPHSQYLMFKISLLQGMNENAASCLDAMCTCIRDQAASQKPCPQTVDYNGFICLAAQLAFEQSNRTIALKALEELAVRSSNPQQVLTALRCLVRLKLTFISEGQEEKLERPIFLSYIEKAHASLSKLQDNNPEPEVNVPEESAWFMKIAWNLALQCEEACPELHQLFILCFKLSQLHPSDPGCLVRQKNCLLMAAAACLQMARDGQAGQDMTKLLEDSIQFIHTCDNICDQLYDVRDAGAAPQPRDLTTPVLLVLYEFEAKARLGHGDLEQVLERALHLPQMEPKAFETMAALALSGASQQRALSIRALKVAIKKYLQQSQVDYAKCSHAFHSLLELALRGAASGDLAGREEAWSYYMDVLDVVQNKAKNGYPEMEILWLMTKAWNFGVKMYSAECSSAALQWCEMGLQLMKQLSSLRGNYESQMTEAFEEMQKKTKSEDTVS